MEAATVTALLRAGWTLEQIVIEIRTTPGEVATALGAKGKSVQSWTLPTLLRAVTWAQWRRTGRRVTEIAAHAGVSHQQVSALTRPFGPYPARHDPVQQWVDARRTGQPLATIADEYRVAPGRVSRATAAYGPFPYPRRPAKDLSSGAIARMFAVAEPTVLRWQTRADFPQPLPDTHPPRWDPTSVAAWADEQLTTCPVCGARVLRLVHHRAARKH